MTIRNRAISDEQKQVRRQAILQAARNLFCVGNFNDVNMARVAKEARIAKGTVYLYFKTKEELFLALLVEMFEAWFEEMDRFLRKKKSSRKACTIAELLELIGHCYEKHPELMRLNAILHTVLERNIDYSAARSFKHMLLTRVCQTGIHLESSLSFLRPGEGAQILLRSHALAIGFQHMAEPSPVMKQVIECEKMQAFEMNFKEQFLATLKDMLYGIRHRSESEQERDNPDSE
ncbi:MAG: TetR family transcriptional regulator [Desulfobacterales bacterium]|jgi:AcrR family transcriptional regulator